MSDKPQEPKQKTPKGLEIPVPKRRDVLDVFRRASRPVQKESPICTHCGKPIHEKPTEMAEGGFRPKWKPYHADCAKAALVGKFTTD